MSSIKSARSFWIHMLLEIKLLHQQGRIRKYRLEPYLLILPTHPEHQKKPDTHLRGDASERRRTVDTVAER